ncbi:hypothetical protein D3C78_1266110 [compost metagenome]
MLPLVHDTLRLWLTVPNPATTGALAKLMLGVVIWQSLVTVMLTYNVWLPELMSRPAQNPPMPIPAQ